MLLKDVKIGGLYRARVSGVFVNVRVLDNSYTMRGRQRRFRVRNMRTNRELSMTAGKFRYEVTE